MSFEAGVGAVEAVGQSAKQTPAENHQTALVGNTYQLAQIFESGLMKASEAAAASFQAAEEARRKTAEVAVREDLNLEATQIDVRPSDDSGSLGKGVATYMQGFQERTSGYPAELDDFLMKVSEGAKINGDGNAEIVSAGVSASDNLPSSKEVLHILQRSFQFAIEAELISNASKHSNQVFNDLMKGQ
jgi:hypothetical protein